MKPTDEELIRWSAKLLELNQKPEYGSVVYYTKEGKFLCFVSNWNPISKDNGQIWDVEKAMQNRKLYLRGIMYNPYTKKYTVVFTDVDNVFGTAAEDDPRRAILLAAWRAVGENR
jgi:hypothetical protein